MFSRPIIYFIFHNLILILLLLNSFQIITYIMSIIIIISKIVFYISDIRYSQIKNRLSAYNNELEAPYTKIKATYGNTRIVLMYVLRRFVYINLYDILLNYECVFEMTNSNTFGYSLFTKYSNWSDPSDVSPYLSEHVTGIIKEFFHFDFEKNTLIKDSKLIEVKEGKIYKFIYIKFLEKKT